MTLEVVEGFAATLAAPQCLARCRAEFREHFGVFRATLRTDDLLFAEQSPAAGAWQRRRNAVFPELAAAGLAHPVGGPCRRQHRADLRTVDAFAGQRRFDVQR